MGTPTRDHLLAALEADLVGPYSSAVPEEILPIPPSRWYLTGFLASQMDREQEDPTDADELGSGTEEEEEETPGGEPEPKQKTWLPASMGLSVLLPPGAGDEIAATVAWAEYVAVENEGDKRQRPHWRRVPHTPVTVSLGLDAATVAAGRELPGATGVWVGGRLGVADAPGLPAGTRALSLFVVNRRDRGEKGREDERFLFQAKMKLAFEPGFVARPNRRDESSDDWDDRVSDLQFRHRAEYAVGHGVAVEIPAGSGSVTRVATTWLPRAEVRRVVTRTEAGVETRMEALGQLADPRAALAGLPSSYAAWIEAQRAIDAGSPGRRETSGELLKRADEARARIAAGVELLARSADVLLAFQLANQAMAAAARKRRSDEPRWRLFQLAFVLMNLGALAEDGHPDREIVDLIFFPTGGGKTEAYLGLIAFLLVLRRLRGQGRPDKGLGVAVLLRYTLRLLTLDQLGRAATLVCALEKLRHADPARLGPVRFSVGLWVGRSATANTLAEVSDKVTEYKNNAARSATSPCPLTHCPWCGHELGRDGLTLLPNRTSPTAVVVACTDFRCDFSAGKNPEGLPVLFVDEQVYRELPSFLVATVDKFAMLPWRGETGMLFGRVKGREGRAFFGPMEKNPKLAERLPDGLLPPELIVQDELHLISGPLGTMVGLYETAIEALCTRPDGVGPKIIASTATVRRAREQIKALFGRPRMALFPPPGVDESDSYFASTDLASPGRLYVGVAAAGRAMKAILLRAYVNLLGSANKVGADGYMTLVGYFNSLRELGGMRRLVEDEVRSRCATLDRRRPENVTASPWFASRTLQLEPVELTSREHTGRIAESKARLAKPYADKEHVDVVLASNMISVGVDIDRLGLMVVAGQPKTTSEYIQASSRVGRTTQWPGLVVTCFNLHRPRDRSHYERFAAYHDSFYRFVEATSLTPFSGPALERGLAGTLVAMTRLLDPAMTPPEGAMLLAAHRKIGEDAVARLADRGASQPGVDGARHDRIREVLVARGRNLLDSWERLVTEAAHEAAARRSYSRFDRDRTAGKPLLRLVLDEDKPAEGSDDAKFTAPTSMRDVEPSVNLWMERGSLGGRK